MQSLIATCAGNAEDVKNELHSIVLGIAAEMKLDRSSIMKMDLMKLKDSFMEFLKKDTLLKSIDIYSSNQKLKPFRKDFDLFVLHRDMYTHGQLHFLHPNNEIVIDYIDNKTSQRIYAYVTHEYWSLITVFIMKF